MSSKQDRYFEKTSSVGYKIPALLLLSFVIWVYAFEDFLSGRLTLSSDALAYREHFKFFIDSLDRGVYPLWDPTRSSGVPIELFLRRIGSFNPLYVIILLLSKMGISFTHAYLGFLMLYFFSGMIAFFKIAQMIFKDTLIALLAFYLLLFSSLGTRMFDSYILLTFVPMVWFFYFFLSFCRVPEKYSLLGIVFCLILLMTTYIPFYFLNIFLTFAVALCVIYPKDVKEYLRSSRGYFSKNKILVGVCLGIICLSTIPGTIFFLEAGQGTVDLAMRHFYSSDKNVLGVGLKAITSWGIEEDLLYSSFFTDVKQFKFAVLYIPILGWIFLLLGLFLKASKKLLFLGLWGFLIWLISSQYSHVFELLQENVFYFKYYRNLHFFLWWALFPIFVLIIGELLRSFLCAWRDLQENKILLNIFLLVSHGIVFFVYTQVLEGSVGAGITVLLSLCFFVMLEKLKRLDQNLLAIGLLVVVIIHPLESFSFFKENATLHKNPYRYDDHYLEPQLIDDEKWQHWFKDNELDKDKEAILQSNSPSFYLSTRWVSLLYQRYHPKVLKRYLRNKILVYDNIVEVEEPLLEWKIIGESFYELKNSAYVPREATSVRSFSSDKGTDPQALVITKENEAFDWLIYDVNKVQFRTNFDDWKFLVYNDAYHPEWKVSIDGKEADLRRANIAFKGLWIPEGEHIISMRFGAAWRYWLNYFLLGMFYLFFAYFVFCCSREYILGKKMMHLE